ncbi:tyrosine-type recombinase/integrase [Helicobacter didelphidarum]|nr:tyrosine-type recombinase/integrase [Helicobacter didelphidarum]
MYQLNQKEGFEVSLKFWIERFFYTKLMKLSAHRVKDKAEFACIIQEIQSGGRQSIENIITLCKKARKIGLLGINTYANPLFVFYRHCVTIGFQDMCEIQNDNIQEFLSIYTTNLSLTTIRNYRFALNNFFDFIQKNNILENGATHIYNIELLGSNQSFKQELPEYLTQDELQRFLEALQKYDLGQKRVNPVIRLRNQLIILMIAYSGARVSEILCLNFKDVSSEKDYYVLRLHGKGNKMRVVYISRFLLESYYQEWIELRSHFSYVNETMPLFINHKLQTPTQPYIYVIIENLLANIGIRKAKNGAHLLRHSFATMLYTKSKDLVLVQETLGHSSIETSRIYTHFDNNKLKHAANVISENIHPD